jgi:benzylsuccinate CoA-transferase BbsF subunit
MDFLRDVRIADFTWAGAGPFATKVFSDFGALVVKVESSTRIDPVRRNGPFKDREAGVNRSGYFASRNTGKKSLLLDLKSDEGRAIALDLIRNADVVTNNFGPGVMQRLGLGYEDARRVKSDIIHLSMPMYGQDGPRANLLGVGMTISAMTGLMWMTAYRDNDPVGPGTHYPDHAANPYHAAFAVLAALRYRRKTGKGMCIDLSQIESTFNFVGPAALEYAMSANEPRQIGNRSLSAAPHNIFPCHEFDTWCAIAVEDDDQWLKLANAMGRSDLASDPALRTVGGRLERVDALEQAVSAWTRQYPANELAPRLQEAGVPAARVACSKDLIEDDEHLAVREYWQYLDHPEMGVTRFTAPPYRIDDRRIELRRPPLLGEHTDEVLGRMLGYPAERIEELRAQELLK